MDLEQRRNLILEPPTRGLLYKGCHPLPNYNNMYKLSLKQVHLSIKDRQPVPVVSEAPFHTMHTTYVHQLLTVIMSVLLACAMVSAAWSNASPQRCMSGIVNLL